MSRVAKRIPKEVLAEFLRMVQEHPELTELIVAEPRGTIQFEDPQWGNDVTLEITALQVKVIRKSEAKNVVFSDTVVLGPRTHVAATIYQDDPKTLWLHVMRRGAKLSVGLEKKKVKQLVKVLMYALEILDGTL